MHADFMRNDDSFHFKSPLILGYMYRLERKSYAWRHGMNVLLYAASFRV